MSQSKKQIHGLKDFGRVELFLNTYTRWDVILAVIIQTMTIIVDFANTNYWLALQGRGPFTVLQWSGRIDSRTLFMASFAPLISFACWK